MRNISKLKNIMLNANILFDSYRMSDNPQRLLNNWNSRVRENREYLETLENLTKEEWRRAEKLHETREKLYLQDLQDLRDLYGGLNTQNYNRQKLARDIGTVSDSTMHQLNDWQENSFRVFDAMLKRYELGKAMGEKTMSEKVLRAQDPWDLEKLLGYIRTKAMLDRFTKSKDIDQFIANFAPNTLTCDMLVEANRVAYCTFLAMCERLSDIRSFINNVGFEFDQSDNPTKGSIASYIIEKFTLAMKNITNGNYPDSTYTYPGQSGGPIDIQARRVMLLAKYIQEPEFEKMPYFTEILFQVAEQDLFYNIITGEVRCTHLSPRVGCDHCSSR